MYMKIKRGNTGRLMDLLLQVLKVMERSQITGLALLVPIRSISSLSRISAGVSFGHQERGRRLIYLSHLFGLILTKSLPFRPHKNVKIWTWII